MLSIETGIEIVDDKTFALASLWFVESHYQCGKQDNVREHGNDKRHRGQQSQGDNSTERRKSEDDKPSEEYDGCIHDALAGFHDTIAYGDGYKEIVG